MGSNSIAKTLYAFSSSSKIPFLSSNKFVLLLPAVFKNGFHLIPQGKSGLFRFFFLFLISVINAKQNALNIYLTKAAKRDDSFLKILRLKSSWP